MKTRKNLISESGAIMLEVVAVLSLMGLMGTMLFRQMYVRNQELHNIQMASEIRVVKDAFAAWIQAQSSRLGTICAVGNDLTEVQICDLSSADIEDIKTFLPEGYFSDEDVGVSLDRGEVLANNFILKLIGYRRGTAASNILTYYGVVIPNPSILPDEGETTNGSWNFRRAARVAMLIGIDGGAYDPAITENEIAGAVGTWHLPINGLIEDADIPTYVAITGTDVFQPEIDVPPVRIGLPEHWDLALRDATAYGKFTAGAPAGCYSKEMSGGQRAAVYNNDSGIFEIQPDNINEPSATCLPAFYVESANDGSAATGNVHVLNDLTVGREWTGANAGKAAIRFDKDGMIVFEKAEADDPQNLGKKVNYMLDPQYTSVMNDIKLMSRGGASLSDILPNYILKSREDWSCTIAQGRLCQLADDTISPDKTHCWCGDSTVLDEKTIIMPNCPKGYKRALLVTPQNFAGGYRQHAEATAINSTGDPITATSASHTHSIVPAYHLITDVTVFQPVIHVAQTETSGVDDDERNEGGTWTLSLGYKSPWSSSQINNGQNGVKEAGNKLYHPQTIDVVIETYCVYDPNNVDWDSDGTVDGADNSPDKNRTMDAATCGRIKAQSVCENMGCAWDATTNVCGVAGP